MNLENYSGVGRYLARFQEILEKMSYRMLSQSFTNSITRNFILCMIPHHEAAIEMCQNLLQYPTDLKLQEIARNIISMQTKGIQEMKSILKNASSYRNGILFVYQYTIRYYEITKAMIEKMGKSAQTENVSYDFISEMIPHHEGAIRMCENLLQYPISPELRRVANNIILEQSRGIQQLQQAKNQIIH